MQRPARVLPAGVVPLRGAVYAAPAAHDPLDVLGGAGLRHGEQPLLGLRRGDACHGAHLGVGDLAVGERLRQARQRAERAGHAHALARGAHVEADLPVEPRRARAEPGVPALAGVELPNEIEQPRGRGLEVRGQLGDLIAQTIDVGWRLHGGLPFSLGRLYTVKFGALARREERRACPRPTFFAPTRSNGHPSACSDTPRESCQAKTGVRTGPGAWVTHRTDGMGNSLRHAAACHGTRLIP